MNSGKEIEEKKADLRNDPESGTFQISAGEERDHYVRRWHTSNFDEDYRPLPSPSRSALRPSCSPPRSKELRVTFQQDNPNRSQNQPLSRALNDTTSSALWKTSQQPLLTDNQRKCEIESSYLDSASTDDPTPQSPNRVLDSLCFTDACWPTFKPSVTSVSWPSSQQSTEFKSRTDKLLQLASDLYEVTHLPDIGMHAQSFSEECPEQSSPRCTLSMESLLESYRPQQTMSTQATSWRLNKRSARSLKTKKQTLLPEDMRAPWPGSVFPPDGPDLCAVLRTLLDLVDQQWSGPLSLHLSPSFMAKAIRLLMPLSSPVPLHCETMQGINNEQHGMKENSAEQWDAWNANQENRTEQEHKQTGVEERRSWGHCSLDFDVIEVGYLKKQLAKMEKEMESLKKRLISTLKENYTLRSDEKKKATACLKSEDMPLDLSAYLLRESKVLQEHEKLLKQLERTLYLLQSNQRSLVAHNNSLLKMIKRRTSKLSETV